MVTLTTEARSFDLVAVIALTIRGDDAISTLIEIIHRTGIRYLKVATSALGASLVSLPVFHIILLHFQGMK